MVYCTGKSNQTVELLEAYRLECHTKNIMIQKLGKELGIKYMKLSIFVVQQMVNESHRKLKEIQQKARCFRQDHLEELANHYANINNMTTHKVIEELIAHEETRQTFTLLRQ